MDYDQIISAANSTVTRLEAELAGLASLAPTSWAEAQGIKALEAEVRGLIIEALEVALDTGTARAAAANGWSEWDQIVFERSL